MDRKKKAGVRRMLLVFLAIALAAPFFAAGCGAQTPEAAVGNFFTAMETNSWNDYLNSILPDNVRRATSEELREQENSFDETNLQYVNIKYKVNKDRRNPDKATVELVSGRVRVKNPQTGKFETTSIAEIKKQYGSNPSINTVLYKGSWFVDVPLAAADRGIESEGTQQ